MTGGCSECVPGCTCGFGGEHVDDNPRCRANWEATAIAAVDLIEGRRVVTGEAGPVLDDVRQAMRYAAYGVTWGVPMSQIDRAVDAVLSVPAVAEVFARDAKVREIVAKWAHLRNEPWPLTVALEVADSTAALFDGGDRP